jgi:hypothetical protein
MICIMKAWTGREWSEIITGFGQVSGIEKCCI